MEALVREMYVVHKSVHIGQNMSVSRLESIALVDTFLEVIMSFLCLMHSFSLKLFKILI